MQNETLNSILKSCYFFGIPSENKLWFSASHLQSSSSNNLSLPCFYTDHFFLDKQKPYIKGDIFFETSFTETLSLLLNLSSKKPDIVWSYPDKSFYLEQFYSLKTEIEQKNLLKGVPYTFITGEFEVTDENKIYLLKSILESAAQSNSLYVYGFWNADEGLIGSTPELLFIQEGKKIKTRALAGTVAEDKSIFNQKLYNEHNFVIDGIFASLSVFGKVTAGKTTSYKLPNLMHLKTEIEIDLYSDINFDFTGFLKALHPTAAIGVLPKNSNSSWLECFESAKQNRGTFAAPFGMIFDKDHSICVSTIRGMSWQNGIAKISAGGGVIAESEYAEEWEEIKLKIRAIKVNLGL